MAGLLDLFGGGGNPGGMDLNQLVRPPDPLGDALAAMSERFAQAGQASRLPTSTLGAIGSALGGASTAARQAQTQYLDQQIKLQALRKALAQAGLSERLAPMLLPILAGQGTRAPTPPAATPMPGAATPMAAPGPLAPPAPPGVPSITAPPLPGDFGATGEYGVEQGLPPGGGPITNTSLGGGLLSPDTVIPTTQGGAGAAVIPASFRLASLVEPARAGDGGADPLDLRGLLALAGGGPPDELIPSGARPDLKLASMTVPDAKLGRDGWYNNPGNIRATDIPWDGKGERYTAGSSGDFETFATPELGVRAMVKNIQTKLDRGIDTPAKLAPVLGPASDKNNPDWLAKQYADSLGIGINDPIPNTPEAFAKLAPRIASIEKNYDAQRRYTPAVFQAGVNAAFTPPEGGGLLDPEGGPGYPAPGTPSLGPGTIPDMAASAIALPGVPGMPQSLAETGRGRQAGFDGDRSGMIMKAEYAPGRSGGGVQLAQYQGGAPPLVGPGSGVIPGLDMTPQQVAAFNALAGLAGYTDNPLKEFLDIYYKSPEYLRQSEQEKAAGQRAVTEPSDIRIAQARAAEDRVTKTLEQIGNARLSLAPNGILVPDGQGGMTRVQATIEQAVRAANGLPVPELGIKGMYPDTKGGAGEPAGTSGAPARAPVGEPVPTPQQKDLQTYGTEVFKKEHTNAQTARTTIESTNELRKLLDDGIISGPGADARRGLLRLGQLVGITGKDENELIANTEAFISESGRNLTAALKGMGPPVSNIDVQVAQGIVGSKDQTVGGLKKILDLVEKNNRRVILEFNKKASMMPQTKEIPSFVIPEPYKYGAPIADGPNGPLWQNDAGKWVPLQ